MTFGTLTAVRFGPTSPFSAKPRRLARTDFEKRNPSSRKMKTLTGVLFAGGESRRMGVDKATLIFDGEPLWSRQLRTLRNLQPEMIVISARTRPIWCPPEIETVQDQHPSRGPLSGLVAELDKLRTTHLLGLAVDLPGITVEFLKKLWSQAQPGVGVIPKNGNYFEPLCAIYPAETIVVAAQMLAAGKFSLQSLLKTLLKQNRMLVYPLNAVERRYCHNVNTPANLL